LASRKGKRSAAARDVDVRRLLEAYPRIFFACHTRHVRDPETGGELSAHQASILAIDRLERRGYVRRGRDPKDGRRVLLRATAAGVRLREAKSLLDPIRVEQVLNQLSPADRAAALHGLALLARASNDFMRAAAQSRKSP
jgi:hypothetical protein